MTRPRATRKLVLVPWSGFSRASASDYFEVFEHSERRVVLAQRTPGAPVGSEELRRIVWALESLLDPRTQSWGLIVDTRAASGSTDPRFGRELTEWSRRATEHFARFAVLVRTNLGMIQATRHHSHADNALVTTDEAQALAWVVGSPTE
ncbi:hypothetical protein ACNOYE_23105 [Nannocystaceae bacterium ST9]